MLPGRMLPGQMLLRNMRSGRLRPVLALRSSGTSLPAGPSRPSPPGRAERGRCDGYPGSGLDREMPQLARVRDQVQLGDPAAHDGEPDHGDRVVVAAEQGTGL